MFPFIIFMVEYTNLIHGGVYYECKRGEHYFIILREYLGICPPFW